jgi:hypothetical protein
VIRCGSKERARAFDPVISCGQRQLFLAIEVVKEASFGQAGELADVLNARGGVSFGADYVQGRVEDPGLRFVSYFRRSHANQPIGMNHTH